MAEHSGTHIDALCHQAEHGRLHGGIEVDARVQTPYGFTALGAETNSTSPVVPQPGTPRASVTTSKPSRST